MTNSIRNMVRNLFASQLGTMDIIVSASDLDTSFLDDPDFPENVNLALTGIGMDFFTDVEGEYTYVHQDVLSIYGMDLEAAYKMKAYPEEIELQADEIVISKEFAETYGYEEGGTIILRTAHEYNELEFKIVKVADYNNMALFSGDFAVVNMEAMDNLFENDGRNHVSEIEIDFLHDADVNPTYEMLKEKYPAYTIESVYENPQIESIIDVISKIFLILFAVCLMMVIFVTISISERVVNERMSVVGTLRSLGLSNRLTMGILLLENSFYGLIGSICGCASYAAIRLLIFGVLFSVEGTGMDVELDFGNINPLLIAGVIVGAIVVECLCPIKEIIKAIKTPIRDIIFANKDTEYKYRLRYLIAGGVLAVSAIICLAIPAKFGLSIYAFIALTATLALLAPFAVKGITLLLTKIFDKAPIAKLALVEVRTKKSTMGSSVLIATAVSLAIVIFTIAGTLKDDLVENAYRCDVLVATNLSQKENVFDYVEDLEEVEKVVYSYENTDYVGITEGEEPEIFVIYGFEAESNEMFAGVLELPDSVEYGEVLVDKYYAKRHGWKVGDEIEITFKAESYYPVKKDMKIAALVDASHVDSYGQVIYLNIDEYHDMYGDKPLYIYVNTTDPEKTKESIEKYSNIYILTCQTREEYISETMASSKSINGAVNFAIFVGIALTFIGAVTNLLVGFDGRRRECAVLRSTSLTRGKLSKLFFLESFFATGSCMLISVPFGILLLWPLKNAIYALGVSMPVQVNVASYIAFAIMLWIVFTLTSLFPIRAARKMKIAEQLKYE